jgi:hypothetical protein
MLRKKITFSSLPDCIHIWSLVFIFVREWNISDFEENLYESNLANWPVSKSELTNMYLKQFVRYMKSVDCEKTNHSNNQM